MNITPPKGRPMLYWVGKKPIESVKSYPTQLVEVYDPFKNTRFYEIPEYEDLEKDWHNLLFEGDNKEVLATLLELGFRGKVDLIYIDPPFASNKDYVRKVELRGFKGSRIENDEAPLLQQVMYEDIWKRDEYFQWIYERLLLMKELLSETGSIYVHLDYRMVHYVKLIMDEVFGEENFLGELIWKSTNSPKSQSGFYGVQHNNILVYSKGKPFYFVPQKIELTEEDIEDYPYDDNDGRGPYQTVTLVARGIQDSPNRKVFEFKGKVDKWLYSKEQLEKWWEEGRIYKTSKGNYRLKKYFYESKGKPISTLWIDKKSFIFPGASWGKFRIQNSKA